ncbi:MAG: hypothetical protein ACYTGW_06715 [Planctomycetota bacterium]
MDHAEIGPVGPSHFETPHGSTYFPLPAELEAEARIRRDSVELTEPHMAAFRLLRERVLENTRLTLGLPRSAVGQYPFACIPGDRVQVFLGRLISDQNLLAGKRRGDWLEPAIRDAIEDSLMQGIEETLEILYELDELDMDIWRLVCSVIDAYYEKMVAVSPADMREEMWHDIDLD